MTIDTGIEGRSPSLTETLLVMDIVDTIRHDDRVRQAELSDGDYRNALKERVRNGYRMQGHDVSDADIERALERLNEERLVHKPMPQGPRRLIWTAYVRRSRYGRNTAAAAAAVMLAWAGWSYGYDRFVVQPRLAAEREMTIQITEVIPREIASAAALADGYATRMGDRAASDRIAKERADAEARLAARDAEGARRGIAAIAAIGEELKHREDAARLVAETETVTEGPIAEATEPKARAVLADIAAQMRDYAVKGDTEGYATAFERFKSFAGYIRTPHKIQIVNRPGIQSGVERTHDQSGSKSWYVVVEAVSPSGAVHPLEIKDSKYGNTRTTPVWAIGVSRETFLAVGRDKLDGVIDNDIAGTKPAGSLGIVWNLDAIDGDTLNQW